MALVFISIEKRKSSAEHTIHIIPVYIGQIEVCAGMERVDSEGCLKMLFRRISFGQFTENGSQIVVSTRMVWPQTETIFISLTKFNNSMDSIFFFINILIYFSNNFFYAFIQNGTQNNETIFDLNPCFISNLLVTDLKLI